MLAMRSQIKLKYVIRQPQIFFDNATKTITSIVNLNFKQISPHSLKKTRIELAESINLKMNARESFKMIRQQLDL